MARDILSQAEQPTSVLYQKRFRPAVVARLNPALRHHPDWPAEWYGHEPSTRVTCYAGLWHRELPYNDGTRRARRGRSDRVARGHPPLGGRARVLGDLSELQGCHAEGVSVGAALDCVRDVAEALLTLRREDGLPAPPTVQKTSNAFVEGQFAVTVG